ncbi:hypothetical protein RhiirA5_431965 [Rhizophagus irregularis]|uniref:Uncharacterized protein n=1 Tax=Rhizophagus irregularis TaxID=588596 RepID=A0A2I1EZW9_9GLOM|nr:hypothetical protein RhiirA5_431965 [Rhizophagus irregularis]PKC62201.1 hypothetical protein RhiirA1_465485 [Rhizophagus irregularis]PKY27652.1 hypothetical protein RhiirB3_443439 [Rhizophagus irregularis]
MSFKKHYRYFHIHKLKLHTKILPIDINVNLDFPLDDHEVSDELANALKTFNFSDMMELKEFLNIPEENMVYEILDDDEIITEIVDNFKKKPNEKNINDDLDEINNNIEEEVINFSVALKNLKKVNIFLL